jgi:RNase H-fold protein (predicted Holliday junction resolvase)
MALQGFTGFLNLPLAPGLRKSGLRSMSQSAAVAALRRVLGASPGGRLLALDVGSSKCGIAVSDPENKMAFPLTEFRRDRGMGVGVKALRDAALQHGAVALVVGLPIDLKGKEGDASIGVRKYIRALQNVQAQGTTRTPRGSKKAGEKLPFAKSSVVFWDERFTTRLVNKRTYVY